MTHFFKSVQKIDPAGTWMAYHDPVLKNVNLAAGLIPHPGAPTPGVPNPNDAANSAQAMTDQMRQRRGLLSNIYAGATSGSPVTGKTQLGT